MDITYVDKPRMVRVYFKWGSPSVSDGRHDFLDFRSRDEADRFIYHHKYLNDNKLITITKYLEE